MCARGSGESRTPRARRNRGAELSPEPPGADTHAPPPSCPQLAPGPLLARLSDCSPRGARLQTCLSRGPLQGPDPVPSVAPRAKAPLGPARPLWSHLSSSPWGTENNGRERPAHPPAHWLLRTVPGNSASLLVEAASSWAVGGKLGPRHCGKCSPLRYKSNPVPELTEGLIALGNASGSEAEKNPRTRVSFLASPKAFT